MTALVLLGLGLRDLLAALPGPLVRRAAGPVAALGVLLGTTALLPAGAGLQEAAAAALTALGVVGLWHALAPGTRVPPRMAVVGGVVVLAVLEQTRALAGPPAPAALTVLAAGLVLVQTANVVTRDVLTLAGRPSTDGPDASPTQGDDAAGLRGGRFIGPMERLLMTILGLMAAWQVVAAIMAAKGIVRFPEISKDARSGHGSAAPPGASAEEFLVGSLASWTLAAGAGLLIHRALVP